MKYMIMMFGCLSESLTSRSPEWIAGMQQLLMTMDREMRDSGELVASEGLVAPTEATTVRADGGTPVATDGPFAEVKEALAGFWIIEGSQERAVEIASRVVAYTEQPMEVRRVMDQPPQP